MAIGTCYSHHYSLLVLAKWIIVKCRTTRWLLVNLCCFPCKDEGDLFWRCLQFKLYACSMPSNPKRWKSLRGVLMNSGDIVLHRFVTFETRLWPTKMPTRIAYSHSRICDLVRSRKVRCRCLIAKEHGVSARVANKLWKHVKTAFWSAVAANLPTCGPGEPIAESGYLQLSGSTAGRIGREGKGQKTYVTWCCWVVVFKKIWIKRGSAIEIIWAWNRSWSVMIFMRSW